MVLELIEDKRVEYLAVALVVVAAANWAFVVFFDTNILVDVVGLTKGTQGYKLAIALIGIAAVIQGRWLLGEVM